MTHNQGRGRLVDAKMTQIIELVEENIKIVILTIFCIFNKIQESMEC